MVRKQYERTPTGLPNKNFMPTLSKSDICCIQPLILMTNFRLRLSTYGMAPFLRSFWNMPFGNLSPVGCLVCGYAGYELRIWIEGKERQHTGTRGIRWSWKGIHFYFFLSWYLLLELQGVSWLLYSINTIMFNSGPFCCETSTVLVIWPSWCAESHSAMTLSLNQE